MRDFTRVLILLIVAYCAQCVLIWKSKDVDVQFKDQKQRPIKMDVGNTNIGIKTDTALIRQEKLLENDSTIEQMLDTITHKLDTL